MFMHAWKLTPWLVTCAIHSMFISSKESYEGEMPGVGGILSHENSALVCRLLLPNEVKALVFCK